MQGQNFEAAVAELILRDTRYGAEAYHFVRETLEYTQRAINKANKGKTRHVTGQELLAGIRTYALAQYGPMTLTLLNEWGIRRCEDFGEIVFNLVDAGLFRKEETDSRDDFRGGYDFTEAFRKPFLPSRRPVLRDAPESTSARN
jgi:uncharacterized repeat protein (TIGR04138 family)